MLNSETKTFRVFRNELFGALTWVLGAARARDEMLPKFQFGSRTYESCSLTVCGERRNERNLCAVDCNQMHCLCVSFNMLSVVYPHMSCTCLRQQRASRTERGLMSKVNINIHIKPPCIKQRLRRQRHAFLSVPLCTNTYTHTLPSIPQRISTSPPNTARPQQMFAVVCATCWLRVVNMGWIGYWYKRSWPQLYACVRVWVYSMPDGNGSEEAHRACVCERMRHLETCVYRISISYRNRDSFLCSLAVPSATCWEWHGWNRIHTHTLNIQFIFIWIREVCVCVCVRRTVVEVQLVDNTKVTMAGCQTDIRRDVQSGIDTHIVRHVLCVNTCSK